MNRSFPVRNMHKMQTVKLQDVRTCIWTFTGSLPRKRDEWMTVMYLDVLSKMLNVIGDTESNYQGLTTVS